MMEYLNISRFLLLSIIAVLIVFLLCYSVYRIELSNIHKTYEVGEINHIELHSAVINHDLSPVLLALKVLTEQAQMYHVIQDSLVRSWFADELLIYAKSTNLFEQLRIIDKSGMEIIRVNYNSGHPEIVPEYRLQAKEKRNYFIETMKQDMGNIYGSRLDLNIENGIIERPFKPVMRFGMPIVNDYGEKIGAVILNFRAIKMLDNLNVGQRMFSSEVMLLNNEGYWLASPDPNDEWGFILENRNDLTMARTMPEKWQKIVAHGSGQFYYDGGLYTFDTVEPFKGLPVITKAGANGQHNWKIVSHIPDYAFDHAIADILRRIIAWGLFFAILLITGIGQWIRATKRKEEAEANSRKLSHVLEETGEAICIMNLRSIIEYVNPAFSLLTGYSSEELLGKTPAIVAAAQVNKFTTHKKLLRTLRNGERWSASSIGRHKNGNEYPVLVSASVVHDEHGNPIHYIGLQQDLTEYKKLEEQFYQAQKMESLGTLVGGIAHDFNNMLAGITMNVYLAKKESQDRLNVIKKLDDVETLVSYAAEMIKQLLTFARKDSIEMQKISLTSFFKQAFKFAESAISKEIRCSCNICQDELFINGDITQIQQILMNLMNNARDALSNTAQAEITCSLSLYVADDLFLQRFPELEGTQFAHISVKDNGSGIPADKLTKVFEPFFTTKEAGKGTGLGLAMIYGAIQSHKGAVEVESECTKGTTFHIYLPLIK